MITVGDVERAAPAFRRAIDLDDENDEEYANAGEWFLELADCLVQLGDVTEARAAYDAGLKLEHPPWLMVELQICVAEGRGEALLERWEGGSGEGSVAQVVELLFALGRHDEGEARARTALGDPQEHEADKLVVRLALADDLMRRGEGAQAVAILEPTPDHNVRFAVPKARALLGVGRTEDASTLLEPWATQGSVAPPEVRLVGAMAAKTAGRPFDRSSVEVIVPKPAWFQLDG